MCGIYLGRKNSYNGKLKHRGIKTYLKNNKVYDIYHEHLPIQSVLGFNPILEIDDMIILFNGELFADDYDNDLNFIKDLFSSTPFNLAIETIFHTDGFYSFIIIKGTKIYAFTDPLGKKQLYYSHQGIGSELRVFHDRKVDLITLSNIEKFGYNHDHRTVLSDVKRIVPNSVYVFDKAFHIVSVIEDLYIFTPKKGHLYDLIDKAVKNRCKSKVDKALLLSGGLDSSIVFHHIDEKIQTYCVDNGSDLDYARLIDQNVESISLDINNEALKAMEMPIDLGSMYPQFSLFSKIKETVVLSGDGADEAFGGYKRQHQYDAQYSDIFCEIPYYHNLRLDRMSMFFTKELRSPFLSLPVIEFSLTLSHKERIEKKFLRELYYNVLPKEIIERSKEALKIEEIRTDPIEQRKKLIKEWMNENFR